MPDEPKTLDNEPKTVDNEPKTDENAPKTKEKYNVNEQPSEKQKAVEQAKNNVQQKANVKNKEEYLKSQNEASSHGVKTKENYIKQHTPEDATKGVKGKESLKAPSSDSAITPKDARKKYVPKKLKTKAEYKKMQEEQNSDQLGNKTQDTKPDITEHKKPNNTANDFKTDTTEKGSSKSIPKPQYIQPFLV